MKNTPFLAALVVFAIGLFTPSEIRAIPQSDMPSFQYDANEFYTDKELKKVAEATRLAVKNNWHMRITAPPEWHDKLMTVVKQTAVGHPVKVDFTNTIIESVVINLSKATQPVKRKKHRPKSGKKPRTNKPAALTAPAMSRPKADKPNRDGVFAEASASMKLAEMKPAMPKLAKPVGSVEKTSIESQPDVLIEQPGLTEKNPSKRAAGTANIASSPGDQKGLQKTDNSPLNGNDKSGDGKQGGVEVNEGSAPSTASTGAEFNLKEERLRLQKLYNKGRKIKKTLLPKNIHKGDTIIVGNGLKILLRSERNGSLRRYWLDGEVNLENRDVFRKESERKFIALRKYTPDDA